METPDGHRARDVKKRLGLEAGGWPCEESGVKTADTTCCRVRWARVAGVGGLWWGDMGNGHVVHDARLQTNRGKGGVLYFMPVTRRNYCRVLRRGLTHSDLPI